jgi:LacI family transcriptional regulator
MRQEESAVSIIDVSKRAGVSPMTVSRVVRSNSNVSDNLKAKVLEAIKELGYVPSISARALRKGSRTLSSMRTCCGLVFGWETQDSASFFSGIAKSAEMEAIDNGLCLLQSHWQNDFEGSLKRLASAFSVPGLCGLILAGQFSVEEVSVITRYCDNIVVIDGPAPNGSGVACIETDYYEGSSLAINHLSCSGSKRLLVLTGPREDHYFARAVSSAVKRHSELFDVIDIEYIDMLYDSGVEIIREKFSDVYAYDAVFTNDEIGLVVLKTFAEMGIKVPEDVQVMGFDNIPYSQYSSPSLSTIHVDKATLGREAIRTLVSYMDSNDRDNFLNVKKIIQTSLVVRESTRG